MARELKGEKLEKELLRLEEMKAYEKENAQYELICGIDEAGRGPLAGPVAAGAVILPKDCQILYLNDSKKLSEKRREELFLEIKEKALAWSVGIATPQRIDEINILQATYEAMREAIKGLGVQPGLLLNDAVTIPGIEIPVFAKKQPLLLRNGCQFFFYSSNLLYFPLYFNKMADKASSVDRGRSIWCAGKEKNWYLQR